MGGLLAIFIGDAARQLAGILLLSLVAVEWGGLFLYRVVGGRGSADWIQDSPTVRPLNASPAGSGRNFV